MLFFQRFHKRKRPLLQNTHHSYDFTVEYELYKTCNPKLRGCGYNSVAICVVRSLREGRAASLAAKYAVLN